MKKEIKAYFLLITLLTNCTSLSSVSTKDTSLSSIPKREVSTSEIKSIERTGGSVTSQELDFTSDIEGAGFNFGDGKNDGSGQFQQDIPNKAIAIIGDIPAGIKDVEIKLTSDKDVDVQLWDGNTKIVAWPDGKLNGAGPSSVSYNGTTISWSGYNGDQTPNGLGNEYIKISGTTQNKFTMKVYGFQSGQALVNYSWKGAGEIKPCGNGTFTQGISLNASTYVGTIPAGVNNLYVKLNSPVDVDVQLWDGTTPIVAWPKGKLNSGSKTAVNYNGVDVEWSGYNGDQTPNGLGNEYIKLTGTTKNDFTMFAYGYRSGEAKVDYSWGGSDCGTPSDVISKFDTAKNKAGSGLGTATSGIERTESNTGYKQSYSGASGAGSGILILKDGASEAYWIHGGIFSRYIDLGGTFKLGYPTSNELKGYNDSVYQMFDGSGLPSLQYVQEKSKVYLLHKDIRDFWFKNINSLGLPISDELSNPLSQSFEKGTIYWNNGNPNIGSKLRSSDPNEVYKSWQTGNVAVKTQQLKDGNASHNLSPAEIIYYTAKENDINPVLLLSKLQDEQSLITQGKSYNDFELRLAKACGYGIYDSGATKKWYGFYPQLAGTSYQFSQFYKSGLSFQQAYEKFTTGSGKYQNFINNIYPEYSNKMLQITGNKLISSQNDYFNGFNYISISDIQKFLDSYSGVLKEKDLFKQSPIENSSIKY